MTEQFHLTPSKDDTYHHLRLFEPLLPDKTSDVRFSKKYQQKVPSINAQVLLAIGDRTFMNSKPSPLEQVVRMYRKVGVVIRPDNLKLMAWYVLIVIIFLYYVIEMGLLMAFGNKFWSDELDYVWWLQVIWIGVLLIDMVISPLKAYYADGLLIKDISLILRRYLKLEVYLDILCILVIGVPLVVGNVNATWLKLLWFIKLYSIDRINDEFQRLTQLYIINNTIFLVCKLVIFSIIYAHFMAIFFYLISMYLYNTNYYGPNTPNIVWVYNSWAFYQIAFLEWYRIYAYIMYYGIEFVTTIAYGDITPKNPIECLYTILAFITQAIFWGYILSEILRLLINVYSFNFDRRYHHFALNYKLKKENVSETTFRQVQQHTEQIDKDDQYRNRVVEDEVLRLLPPDPLYGLLLAIHKVSLTKIGFEFVKNLSYRTIGFADSKSVFLEQFMKEIKEERYFAGDIFYTQGEVQQAKPNNHCAYFYTNPAYSRSVVLGVGKHVSMKLEEGQKDYTLIEEEGSYKLHTVSQFFGNVEFLTGRKRDHWAICRKNCLLFAVSREALLKNYHLLTLEERQSIVLSAELAPNRICLVCEFSHNFLNCPYVFAITREVVEEEQQSASRSVHLRTYDRTRLKSLSSWKAYSEIRSIKMPINHQYTQRLLFNQGNQEHFMELELEENFDDECFDLEEELHETEVIIDTLYRKELEELDLAEEAFTSSKAYNFKFYKRENNIDSIAERVRENKNMKQLKRNAITFRVTNNPKRE